LSVKINLLPYLLTGTLKPNVYVCARSLFAGNVCDMFA